jgi:hypothetical protein
MESNSEHVKCCNTMKLRNLHCGFQSSIFSNPWENALHVDECKPSGVYRTAGKERPSATCQY